MYRIGQFGLKNGFNLKEKKYNWIFRLLKFKAKR